MLLCPITKASNNSHFHSSHFFAFYFPSQFQWFFLSLLPFLILEMKKKHAFRVTIPQGQHHVSSAQQSWALRGSYQVGWPKTNTPCGNNFFLFIPFRRRYQRLQNSPALCDVASSISQLFVPHFAMSAFTCIYLQRINKQRNTSFEFFSILSTFGRLKQ